MAKNHLIQSWPTLDSEEILRRLEAIAENTEAKVDDQAEVWVLRALAHAKAVSADADEMLRLYYHCRDHGAFGAALVLNNLGVIHARRQSCAEALNAFMRAIRDALAAHPILQAPFYNLALILHHLHECGRIVRPAYLDVLDEVSQLIVFAESRPGRSQVLSFTRTPRVEPWSEEAVHDAIRRIARYGHDHTNRRRDDVFAQGAAYLVPFVDLFGSFGDVSAGQDQAAAHAILKAGADALAMQDYGGALAKLDMVAAMSPDLSADVEEKIRGVLEEWRARIVGDVTALVESHAYDQAARALREVADDRVRHANDSALITKIRRQKHQHELSEAEAQIDRGDVELARERLIALLQEGNLAADVRRHASGKLADLLMPGDT